MLAYGIGNAFCFHLTGAAAGAFLLLFRGRVQINVMQLGVGNLMDKGLDRLQLAFALVKCNALFCVVVIAVCAAFNPFKANGNRRSLLQCLEKVLVLLNAARQRIHSNVRDLLAVGLAHIKDAYHLKGRDGDFFLLGDGLAVLTDNRLAVRVKFFQLFFDFIRRGGKDFNAFFAALYMAFKLVTPFVKASHKGSVRLLHHDQQRIVKAVIVELGHGFQVVLVSFTIEKVFYASFKLCRNLFDLARRVGGSQLNGANGDRLRRLGDGCGLLGNSGSVHKNRVRLAWGNAVFFRNIVVCVPYGKVVFVVVDIAVVGESAAVLPCRVAPKGFVIKILFRRFRQFQLVQLVNYIMPVVLGIVDGRIKPVAVKIVGKVDRVGNACRVVAVDHGCGKFLPFLLAALGKQRGKVVQLVQTFAGTETVSQAVNGRFVGGNLVFRRVNAVNTDTRKSGFHFLRVSR